jgi:hypothetical protein
MLNCEDRLAADPAGLAGRMAGLAGIDAHRARQWLFARSVQESIGSPLMGQVATGLCGREPRGRPWFVTLAFDPALSIRIRTARVSAW